MRKFIRFSILAAAAFVSFSCVEEQFEQNTPGEKELFHIVFNAESASTKTVLAEDGRTVNWLAGDAIAVFPSADMTQKFQFTTQDTGTSANFAGDAVEDSKYFAFYPFEDGYSFKAGSSKLNGVTIPDHQTLVAGTFPDDAALLFARSEGTSLRFHNALSILKFVPQVDPSYTIKEITIQDNGNASIAGNYVFNTAKDALESTGGKSALVLTSEGGFVSGATYYCVVRPAPFANGFTINVKVNEVPGVFTLSSEKPMNLRAGEILNLGIINADSFNNVVLNGEAEIQNFVNENPDGSVDDLAVIGAKTTATLNGLAEKVKVVNGKFLYKDISKNCSVTDFLKNVQFNGGIEFDNVNGDNINMFKTMPTHINGDFILRNIQWHDFGWNEALPKFSGFQAVEKVEGNFIVSNVKKFIGRGLRALAYVGGDVIIENSGNSKNITDLAEFGIKHIGGNLVIKGISKMNSLAGLEKIEYIGGDVTIIANVPEVAADAAHPGYCLVRYWMDNGIIKNPDAKITLQTTDGKIIDVNSLETCMDCPHNPDMI